MGSDCHLCLSAVAAAGFGAAMPGVGVSGDPAAVFGSEWLDGGARGEKQTFGSLVGTGFAGGRGAALCVFGEECRGDKIGGVSGQNRHGQSALQFRRDCAITVGARKREVFPLGR